MAEYMLDMDISSYIMKRSHDSVLRRLQKVPIGAVCEMRQMRHIA